MKRGFDINNTKLIPCIDSETKHEFRQKIEGNDYHYSYYCIHCLLEIDS